MNMHNIRENSQSFMNVQSYRIGKAAQGSPLSMSSGESGDPVESLERKMEMHNFSRSTDRNKT